MNKSLRVFCNEITYLLNYRKVNLKIEINTTDRYRSLWVSTYEVNRG